MNFSGHFSHKNEEKKSDEKSAKNPAAQKEKSAKNPFCRKLSGPVRDTPPYRAIPFQDSIAEGLSHPFALFS